MYNEKTIMKNSKIRNFFILIIILGISVFPPLVFSQTNQNPTDCLLNGGKICNPIPSVGSLPAFIKTFLEGAIKIGIPVAALAIVFCGFLFVSARGKPEELKKAKDALLYTLIGTAVLFGSWAIAKLISDTVLAL
jgi:hypothetical protein